MTFHGIFREADVALAELIMKSARGQVSVGQWTVTHAVEAGLRQAELEGLEPTTLRGYRTSADCHVLPALGSRRLSYLTAEHLDRFHGALRSAARLGDRLSWAGWSGWTWSVAFEASTGDRELAPVVKLSTRDDAPLHLDETWSIATGFDF